MLMKLRDLFSDDAKIEAQAAATAITGLAVDSRLVRPGDLFFALRGPNDDGHGYVADVLRKGAAGAVIDRAVDQNTGSIRMRLVFPNPDHELRSGMSGQLRVLTAPVAKSILIPYKAAR